MYQGNKPEGSRGAIFARQKKSQNSPDVGGDFDLTGEELAYVIANAHTGSVKLDISGWRKVGKSNVPFTSLAIAIPYEVRKPQQPPYPTPAQQDNYQQPYSGGGGPAQQPYSGGTPAYAAPPQPPRYQRPVQGVAQTSPQRPLNPPRQQSNFEQFAKGDGFKDDVPF